MCKFTNIEEGKWEAKYLPPTRAQLFPPQQQVFMLVIG